MFSKNRLLLQSKKALFSKNISLQTTKLFSKIRLHLQTTNLFFPRVYNTMKTTKLCFARIDYSCKPQSNVSQEYMRVLLQTITMFSKNIWVSETTKLLSKNLILAKHNFKFYQQFQAKKFSVKNEAANNNHTTVKYITNYSCTTNVLFIVSKTLKWLFLRFTIHKNVKQKKVKTSIIIYKLRFRLWCFEIAAFL